MRRFAAAFRQRARLRRLVVLLVPLLLYPNAGDSTSPSSPSGSVGPLHQDPVTLDRILKSMAGQVDSLANRALYVQADSMASLGRELVLQQLPQDSAKLTFWLVKSGGNRLALGKIDEAEQLLQSAFEMAKARGRKGREDALDAVRLLYSIHMARTDLPKAEETALRGLEICHDLFGPEDARQSRDLSNLAEVYLKRDRLADAGRVLEEARHRIEVQQPTASPDLARELGIILGDVLTVQGLLAQIQGRQTEAVSDYERSVEVKQRWLDHEDPSISVSLSGLAESYRLLGDLPRAEELLRQTLEMRIRIYGPDHPRVARILSNLALVLNNRGDYAGAVDAYRRALAIWERSSGKRDPEVTRVMLNLSGPLLAQGQEGEAIRLIREAVQLSEEAYGPDHSNVGAAVSMLGDALQQAGDPKEAEGLYRRALGIFQAVYGRNHPQVAATFYRLGKDLKSQERFDEAREAVQMAVQVAVQVYSPDNYRISLYKVELADLLLLSGKAAEARTVYEQCLASLRDQLGSSHVSVLTCLSGITSTSLELGMVQQASNDSEREIETTETAVGSRSPAMVRSLSLGVAADLLAHQWEEAIQKGIRATKIALDLQDDLYQVASEREATTYSQLPQRMARTLLGAMLLAPSVSDSLRVGVFSVVARSHGQVFSRLARRQREAKAVYEDPAAAGLSRRFRAASQRLANLMVRGPRPDQPGFEDELRRARLEKEGAERDLSAAAEVSAIREGQTESGGPLEVDRLTGALPANALLIHYVRVPALKADRSIWRSCIVTPSIPPARNLAEHYGMFCLRKDPNGTISLRYDDLGDCAALDTLIFRWRRVVDAPGRSLKPSARQEAEFRQVARDLYEAAWSPIENLRSSLLRTQHKDPPLVLIVPESWFYLVDFNTLLSPDDSLVIEMCKPYYLPTAVDLVAPHALARTKQGRGLLLVGNPTNAPDASPETRSAQEMYNRPFSPCLEMSGINQPLPGSEAEVRELSDLCRKETDQPVQLLLNREATEGSCKAALTGKRMIHIASHGFFCPARHPGTGTIADEFAANPLLSSGLVLCPGPGDEDGFLTAQEIVGYDLRGTDWVVLSACNSGLGRLLPGEGVYGLRRAFEMAGARTVIMALWRLRDDVATDLMDRIYQNRFQGLSTVDAVRQAELELLRSARARQQRIHPALWGGIIAEGDWR